MAELDEDKLISLMVGRDSTSRFPALESKPGATRLRVEGLSSADPASYFAALLRALRLYLAARALPEAEALTAPELAALPESALPAPATKDRAAALVARADRLRYGGWEQGEPTALLEAAAEARAIGEANEEVLRARV